MVPNSMSRIPSRVGFVGLAAVLLTLATVVGAVLGDHEPVRGKVGKKPGAYKVHHKDGHHAHAHVNNGGKVTHVTVHNDKKEKVNTKKVKKQVKVKAKTKTKTEISVVPDFFVTVDGSPSTDVDFVATDASAPAQFAWLVGWQYNCPCGGTIVVVVIWFPESMCQDGTKDCSDYDPNYDPN